MRLTQAQQTISGIALLLLWCVGLLAYRSYLTPQAFVGGDKFTRGMLWNLFLAVVPLLWSLAFQAASARNRPASAASFFCLWLLFLPNAPYLFTDLIHLHSSPNVPLWYVLAVLMSCAGTGTLLGYLSLSQVHKVVEQKHGKKMGWTVAAGSLLLCGFGIYLGRSLHWNSWDVFVHPRQLLSTLAGQVIHPGGQPNPIAVTLVFGVGLMVGYIALRVLSASLSLAAPPPSGT